MRLAHRAPAVAIAAVIALAVASESQTTSTTTGGSRVMFVSQASREPYRFRAIEISPRGIRSVALEGQFLGDTSFAPRGDFIAYSVSSGADHATFRTEFGAPRRVVVARTRCRPNRPCSGHSHAWSRDGRRLVLSMWERSRDRVFVLMDSTSQRRREITPRGMTEDDDYGDWSWSPSGRLIGFVRHYGQSNTDVCCKLEYHVMRPDGSRHRWVYRHRRGDTFYDALNFAWAPGSARLAFTWVGRGGISQLGVVDLRTRRLRWLHDHTQTPPTWSPDSRWIAVASPGTGITLVDPAGRERPRRLVPKLAVWGVAFAADGRSVIATVARGEIGSSPTEIQIVPLDGGPARLLYRAPRGWSISTGVEAWPAAR